MKILMMVLMTGLMGCKSTPMKSPTFFSGKYSAGEVFLLKKGYDFNGTRLCFYSIGDDTIKIPSSSLDKWNAGRCASSIILTN
tara:strand:- start:1712 stop:1960 length:249 start_codon:yes stop_codon:yes gene_type:complete